MKSFDPDFLEKLVIPHRVIRMISEISMLRGKQELYLEKAPEVLANLKQVAIIESVESSNRIENIVVGAKTIQAIVHDNEQPDEAVCAQGEVAGYRDVLKTIHDSAPNIPFSERIVLQFHRDLMKYASSVSGQPGGAWKATANQIAEKHPDGSIKRIRFQPVEPYLTEPAMVALHQRFNAECAQANIEPLILLPLYVLDFLCIHPFSDGNGRMSRLLTTLMLYHQGFEVCRYISLERLVERTKDSYYETLYSGSQGWHDGQHDPLPFLEYLLSLILGAYRQLADRSDTVRSIPEVKTGIVLKALDEIMGDFTLTELEKKCPLVSRITIRRTLKTLEAEGKVALLGKGRGAKWVKH
jgi:Fic family protein